jgi:hypothetical protein
VLSDLKGHVLLRDGTARLSNLSFSVPGALAQMQGTYDLITEQIDLRGTLKTDSEPSDTTHGMKALMLKVLDPFFKKKHTGYAMPVKITGTYEHPEFGLDLGEPRNKSNHPDACISLCLKRTSLSDLHPEKGRTVKAKGTGKKTLSPPIQF